MPLTPELCEGPFRSAGAESARLNRLVWNGLKAMHMVEPKGRFCRSQKIFEMTSLWFGTRWLYRRRSEHRFLERRGCEHLNDVLSIAVVQAAMARQHSKFTRAIQLANKKEESDGNKGLSLGRPYLSDCKSQREPGHVVGSGEDMAG